MNVGSAFEPHSCIARRLWPCWSAHDGNSPRIQLAQITIQLDLGCRLTVPPPSRPSCRSRCGARRLAVGA